jgi:protein-L-isoaspartate(D-aspartate) O-methyltransferase
MRRLSFLFLSVFVLSFCASRPLENQLAAEDEFLHQREQMVEQQLRTRNIKSTRVLDAMRKVPRHLFMPEEVRRDAYLDRPVPIGEDQTISQPYIVALMTQTVEPQPHQRALEIGTGSGYQAAVLAELVGQVYTIEIISLLGERARGTLEELGYDNVEVRVGDGYKGWPEEAPFDIILVTAAAGEIPEPLLEQLAEGGKLVMPVGQVGGIQALTTVTKTGGEVFRTHVTDVRFVPMTGEIQRRWPGSSISPGLP